MGRAVKRESVGAYSITSPGISERVDTSAVSLGAAMSKAQTIGTRLQRELLKTEDDDVTISIRRLGSDALLARVVVTRDVIATAAFA